MNSQAATLLTNDHLLEAMPDACIIAGPDGTIAMVNSQAEKLFGYGRQALLGQSLALILPEHDWSRYFLAPIACAMGEGGILPASCADSSRIEIEMSLSPQQSQVVAAFRAVSQGLKQKTQRGKDLEASPDAMMVVNREGLNVSERERCEDKFRSFLEFAPDAILICDPQGRIAMANLQTERLFGYPRSELIQRRVEMLTPVRFRTGNAGLRQHYFEFVQNRAMGDGQQLYGLHQDGSEFPIEVTLSPLDTSEASFVSCSVRDVSERRKSEESRSRLVALVESSDDAIIGKTLDGVVTGWNRGAEKIFGYSAEEMVGHSLATLFPQERLHEYEQILHLLAAGQAVDHLETVRVCKDGRNIDMSITISLARDRAGKVIGASKVARDITQRKRVEKQLMRAQEILLNDHQRLRAIFNSTFQFSGLLSTEGCLLEVNDAALDFAGVLKEEVIGKYYWETPWWSHSPDLQQRLQDAVAEARLGKKIQMEATHMGRSGKVALVHFSLRPLLNEQGEVCFLVPESRDVTQERQFQEALSESEARFRLAFQYAGVGMALVNLGGRLIQVNSALCDIVGYSEAELLQSALQEITHPDDLAADLEELRGLIEGKSAFSQTEKRYFHKKGEILWILKTITLIRSQAREPQYFIVQIQDVSARKRAEKDLKLSLAEKDVMLQEIHHRVKNNLQVITSMIQLHSYYISDAGLLDALRDCQARIQSMALVHERLYNSNSFARLDFGAHLQDLTHLVADSQDEAQSKVELLFRLDPVELSLETAMPMGLIANEILSNAFKHAFRGRSGGQLEVELRAQGNEVSMAISDDGPGLAPDFELKDRPGSLGLRLIKILVKQLRGQLTVGASSSLGGVRFTLTMNLSQQTD